MRAYCDLYGHHLAEVVIDAGQSAKTLNRPGLARVLAALEAGEAAGVLIFKLDRLTRSVRDLGHLLETYFTRHALPPSHPPIWTVYPTQGTSSDVFQANGKPHPGNRHQLPAPPAEIPATVAKLTRANLVFIDEVTRPAYSGG